MVLAHPTLPHPPPSNKSVTRLVPTPLGGPPPPAWARLAGDMRGDPHSPAPCAAARETPRGPRRAGGCTGGRLHGRPAQVAAGPSAVRSTDWGGSIPGPRGPGPRTPPQFHIPSSPTAGRARVTGPKTPAFPGPCAGSSGGWLQPGPRSRRPLCPARGRGDGRRRPTPTHREPARTSPAPVPRPSPPPWGRRGQAGEPGGPRPRKHTHFHIAALVLKALDAVVLQARVLGHGCARLRRRLLLRLRRRRRVSAREGEVGEGRRGWEGEGERRARSVTPPSARWQQRRGRRRPTAGRGGNSSEESRAPGLLGSRGRDGPPPPPSPGRHPTVLGMTPTSPRASPQSLEDASHVPGMEPDRAAFTVP